MISIVDLHASYAGAEILHGISADFPAGKISVVMGPNGCGKSTTLRSLVRLVPEIRGSVTLDGQELAALTPQELARRVAYLPQSRNVPDISVERLVLHGRFPYLSYPRRSRQEDLDQVARALDWVGLAELRRRKLGQLSGGQRQKAYLAMALAQDTEVILMDEPTTFLDIRNQFEMLGRARALADSGKTVVMILHDFESVLRYADRVILMAEGRILTAGDAGTASKAATDGKPSAAVRLNCNKYFATG
ncbi:MAG: ABC transporter ATP-binding protein, partial [Firmicutes bacterium]|nr:ABC transporter ATP-binding protein [Bacillota bacterium]